MSPLLSPSAGNYVLEWGITLVTGGAICLLVGVFVGWIIWRNTRRLAEKVEEGNRNALAEYERSNDEVSKIKSELAEGG